MNGGRITSQNVILIRMCNLGALERISRTRCSQHFRNLHFFFLQASTYSASDALMSPTSS